MSGSNYRADAMNYLLCLPAFFPVYNGKCTIITCRHPDERITVHPYVVDPSKSTANITFGPCSLVQVPLRSL